MLFFYTKKNDFCNLIIKYKMDIEYIENIIIDFQILAILSLGIIVTVIYFNQTPLSYI